MQLVMHLGSWSTDASRVLFLPSNTSVLAQLLVGSPAHVFVLDGLAELSRGCCSF